MTDVPEHVHTDTVLSSVPSGVYTNAEDSSLLAADAVQVAEFSPGLFGSGMNILSAGVVVRPRSRLLLRSRTVTSHVPGYTSCTSHTIVPEGISG